MGQIEPQIAKERFPALRVTLELVVPVVRAREPAMDHTHDASSACASLDDPFGRNRSRFFHGLDQVAARRVPELDLRDGVHARTEAGGGGAVYSLLDRARDEPGRDSGAGGDRLPDFLRGPGNLDLGVDGSL